MSRSRMPDYLLDDDPEDDEFCTDPVDEPDEYPEDFGDE